MAMDKIKRKTGFVWRARVVLPNGQRKSQCFKRKEDAKQYEAQMLVSPELSESNSKKEMSFEEFAEEYIRSHLPTLEFGSRKKYETTIRLVLIPRFGSFRLSKISSQEVQKFAAELSTTKQADSSKNSVFVMFKMIMKRACAFGLITSIPGAMVKAPRIGISPMDYWTEETVLNFLGGIRGSPRETLYLVALNSGMRAGELIGLKWDVVDFDRDLIQIRRTFCQKQMSIKETTKSHRSRSIHMNAVLKTTLLSLRTKSKIETVFSLEELGCRNPSHLSRMLRADCKRVGVRGIRFHDLRHTYATSFVANGGSLYALSKILGHSTIETTELYAHFSREQSVHASMIVSFNSPSNLNIISIKNGHNLVTA